MKGKSLNYKTDAYLATKRPILCSKNVANKGSTPYHEGSVIYTIVNNCISLHNSIKFSMHTSCNKKNFNAILWTICIILKGSVGLWDNKRKLFIEEQAKNDLHTLN